MSVTFNTVDPNSRASQIFIELQGIPRGVSGSLLPPIGLIVGQYDQAKVAGITDYTPVQVFTADEVGDKAGFGSEAHRQALWIFGMLGGFYSNMWWSPVPEIGGAVVATGTIIFANTAGSSGTYYFSIGGDLITVPVASGDTHIEVGTALVAAITANPNSLVTAADAGGGADGTVTLTAKNKGLNGNQIKLVANPSGEVQSAENPTTMTVGLPGTGGYLTSGAGLEDTHDIFFNASDEDILGDRFYTCISGPYNDAANIGYYNDSLDARILPGIKRPFDSFFGYVKEDYAAAFAIPDTINGEGISPVWDARSYSPSWELQAAVMGLVMWSTVFDPGRPFKTLATGIPFNTETGDLSYSKNDALFREGMGYFKNIAGSLVVGDLALSYRTNGAGGASTDWYDSVSMHRRQQKIYDMESLFNSEPYIRGIVSSDDSITTKPYVIKPKKVIADLSALVDYWDGQGWTKNAATVKASITAEINALFSGRIDAEVEDDEAAALRIIAIAYKYLTD